VLNPSPSQGQLQLEGCGTLNYDTFEGPVFIPITRTSSSGVASLWTGVTGLLKVRP